jgi:hypothetical protein
MDISAIEGEELSSVTFVQDYVQLDFNGPQLTLFIWPEVFRAEGSYAFGEPGYRDMLCALIGETATTTTIENGVALEIEFETGVILRTSLREEDYVGPEAINFRTGKSDDPLLVI